MFLVCFELSFHVDSGACGFSGHCGAKISLCNSLSRVFAWFRACALYCVAGAEWDMRTLITDIDTSGTSDDLG